jgi:hypothetical protein
LSPLVTESLSRVELKRKTIRHAWVASILGLSLSFTPLLAPLHELGHALFAWGEGRLTWSRFYYNLPQPWIMYLAGFLLELMGIQLISTAMSPKVPWPKKRHPALAFIPLFYAWGVGIMFLISEDLYQAAHTEVGLSVSIATWLLYWLPTMILLQRRVNRYLHRWTETWSRPNGC